MFAKASMKGSLIILLCIALVLVIIDRIIRIQPYITTVVVIEEPFQMPVLKNGRATACGNGLISCPEGTKCGNGLCISTDPFHLTEKYPLPVLP